jgi:uncharacterized protein (DUF433 family)
MSENENRFFSNGLKCESKLSLVIKKHDEDLALLVDWHERISVDPKVLVGKPVIKGTRLSVEFILDLLANGWTIEQILDEYPQLEREDIIAVLKYAAEMVKEEKAYPLL